MLQRGRSRSPKKGKHPAEDVSLESNVEGFGPGRGRDLLVSVRSSADEVAITFHVHSVVLLKYFQAGAFRDHLAFAEECDGDCTDTVELIGDPPHVWRILLELIYKHFDLLYDKENRCYTVFVDLAETLLGKMQVTSELLDLALLTHKHGCDIFQAIVEKRVSRPFYAEQLGSSGWLRMWTPANAGALLRCGMRDAVKSWFVYDCMGEPGDIPCTRINNFLRNCSEDELRCIALDGAKHILDNMKDEEDRKAREGADDETDSSSEEAYQQHGFKYYWDNYCYETGEYPSNNTVADIQQMLEVIMQTCRDCPGCADAIQALCKVTPKCLDTSTWEPFVSELGSGTSDQGIDQHV